MRLIIFLFISLAFAGSSLAQSKAHAKVKPGKIIIHQDPRIELLVIKHSEWNKDNYEYPGYRIQISAGKNRNQIYELKAKFYKSFPDITSYVVYQQPNFKLRVGDYDNRLEAFNDHLSIIENEDFRSAFIVSDNIVPELLHEP